MNSHRSKKTVNTTHLLTRPSTLKKRHISTHVPEYTLQNNAVDLVPSIQHRDQCQKTLVGSTVHIGSTVHVTGHPVQGFYPSWSSSIIAQIKRKHPKIASSQLRHPMAASSSNGDPLKHAEMVRTLGYRSRWPLLPQQQGHQCTLASLRQSEHHSSSPAAWHRRGVQRPLVHRPLGGE